MKVEWLDRALFVSSHYYCLCTNEKQFHAALKHLHIQREHYPDFVLHKHSDATVHYLESGDGLKHSAIVCLRVREGIEGTQIAALLVHEAVHIWQATKKDYGEKEPSSELEAYAIQSISQRLMESYAEQMK